MKRVTCIVDAGINHNGSLDVAKQLIDAAVDSKADFIKFQKRTVDIVYTPEELAKPRENPFGPTNGDLKRGLEFGQAEYEEIARYCKEKGIGWFASCWDEQSVDFIAQFKPPYFKIASASLTDDNLLRHHLKYKTPVILSTGMSTMEQIRHAVDVLGKENIACLMHCTSTYPTDLSELNLRCIQTLQREFPGIPIGYSGHEGGLATTYAAVVLGAVMVERHLTISRMLYGSDQAASVEPQGMKRLIRDIRALELAMGDGIKRVYDSEKPIIQKLRRVK